jgi:hypothetical protein
MTLTALFGVVLAAVDHPPRIPVGALGNAARTSEREKASPARISSDRAANDGDRPIDRVAG